MKVRMKNNLCAALHCPTHCLWITPAFMANRYTKGHWTGLKDPPACAGCIDTLLGRVELDFVLETSNRSVPLNNQGRGQQCMIDDALSAKHNGNSRLRGSRGNGRPGSLEENSIRSGHRLSYSSIAGNKALRKADDACTSAPGFSDRLLSQRHRVLRASRKLDIGKCDSKVAHYFPLTRNRF